MATATAPAAEPGSAPARRYRGGWRIVARKELADSLTSVRFIALLVLVTVAAVLSVEQSSRDLSDLSGAGISELPSVFLGLFYLSSERVLSFSFTFYEMVGLLGPLFGIAIGFDAINGERASGTLPRLVSQPIYRDDVINGKFAAGLTLIGLTLTFQVALVTGLGILRLGVTPSGEDLMRLVIFLVISIVAVGVWLAFAILCSVLFRQAAASAMLAIAFWLLFVVFAGSLAELAADRIADVPDEPTQEEVLRNERLEQTLARFSPKTLYVEASEAILSPLVVSLDVTAPEDTEGLLPDTELPLRQSLLLVWPQIVALIAVTVVLFGVTYVVFMRQEVRA